MITILSISDERFHTVSLLIFADYVRRLDEILAQKIEKFTQLRGKVFRLFTPTFRV